MRVLSLKTSLLSNSEVLSLLKEIQEKRRKLKDNKQLATIAYESINFLEDSAANTTTDDQIQQFLIAVKDTFRLTKAEKLQIINQRPITLVELQLLIEENEERFSEEAMDQLLTLINNTLINTDIQTDEDIAEDRDNSDDNDEDIDNNSEDN
ncbi:DNA-directed RNA polymerase III subunit RPC9-like [Oppia nitens]|uniref:DNA-directed RNA polymerase III subunit RPC9-like n=1 Tax=Oppia nitens TaxID=1686743 RepID=UPI0023DA62B7|nr:DNA-directed RNA polymerase III subunit RPC9-like [Oppia nitens]